LFPNVTAEAERAEHRDGERPQPTDAGDATWAQWFQELCQHGHDAGGFVEDGYHQGELDGGAAASKGADCAQYMLQPVKEQLDLPALAGEPRHGVSSQPLNTVTSFTSACVYVCDEVTCNRVGTCVPMA